MKHLLHENHNCECIVCKGGLALCERCGGAEASMPTDCPGRKLTADESDMIQAGNLDYKDGKFIVLGEL